MPYHPPTKAVALATLATLTSATFTAADVTISEFKADSSEYLLRMTATGIKTVGSGAPWFTPEFDDSAWPTGAAPIGFGVSGLGTDLTAQLKDVTPSLYIRKTFTLTEAQAATTESLRLTTDIDDGFIAYLNGHELARSNMAAPGAFVHYDQPAYMARKFPTDDTIDNAGQYLRPGLNVLAIQAHNGDEVRTTSDIHGPTLDRTMSFRATMTIGTTSPVTVATAEDTFAYFPGLIEPSGGVFEPAVLVANDQRLGENNFADWIELHNDAAAPVDISGWSLTDNNTAPDKWSFPAGTTIPANGYLLVLADGRGEVAGATYLHTNFKLATGGEFLGLYDDTGALRHSFGTRYPEQYMFYSYGTPPGGGAAAYLEYPTPGKPNTGTAVSDRTDRPDFDQPGGFHDEAITLTITATTEGALIRYTTDGSDPSLTNGTDYTGPIEITPTTPAPRPPAATGTVIRARAFKEGLAPSRIRTQTFLVGMDARLASAPALIFTGDQGETISSPHGILTIRGGAGLGSDWQPRRSTDYNHPRLRGRAMERPVNAEFYFADNTVGFNTTAGLRMAASNWSRPRMQMSESTIRRSPWDNNNRTKCSFNLYFRDDYGNPDVGLPLNGTDYPVDNFTRLRIRAGKNDINNPFVIDEWIRRLHGDMGHAASEGVINSLWINGSYKGTFNAVERLRHPYFADHHGVDRDSEWDVYQAGNSSDPRTINLVTSGDRTSWDTFFDRLEAPVTEENWNAVTEWGDIANIADYFLLNVYVAMWDWPHNNFVAARQRNAPGAKFRFYVWDAEGGIANAGDSSITKDSLNILFNDRSNSNRDDVAKTWQLLNRWPEFKLFFADRINKFMFNGGILDDRDTRNSHLWRSLDAVEDEFEPLALYTIRTRPNAIGKLNSWVRPRTGRRDRYLFGSRGFRFRGLWPETEPAVFSQHGGDVAAGFNLTLTHNAPAGSTVYYTLDGTDPRAYGDATSPAAQVFNEATGLDLTDTITTISTRVKNANGEWSPITTATFTVDTVAPTRDNLVISQFMYNPADPTEAEIAAGVTDADEFEFIQLKNTTSSAIDLAGCDFVSGIAFDFDESDARTVAAGGYLLVVENIEAFRIRYGTGFDSIIAGQYTGNMRNSGETIRLVDSAGETLHEFTYSDDAPWPTAADGRGAAVSLVSHESPSLDHSLPGSWAPSTQHGGSPDGTVDPLDFNDWRAVQFSAADAANDLISGPQADQNKNGISNFVEFATGAFPGDPAGALALLPSAYIEEIDDQTYLAIDVRTPTAAGLTVVAEVSQDLVNWSGGAEVQLVSGPDVHPDGSTTYQFRSTRSLESTPGQHIRARFTQ